MNQENDRLEIAFFFLKKDTVLYLEANISILLSMWMTIY